MAISAVCFVQCLLTPVLLVLAPSVFSVTLFESHHFHQLLLFFILPVSSVALFLGCRSHRSRQVMVTGGLGLSLVVLAAVLGHERITTYGEMGMTLTGAFLIAIAHMMNYRLCRAPGTCDDHGHESDGVAG